MNRIVLIGAAAFVGTVAAVLVLRSPDTGDDLPDVKVAAPVAAPAPPPKDLPNGLNLEERHPDLGSVVNPVAKAREDRLKEPDAMMVGDLGAAWTGIRFELGKVDDEGAKALSAEAGALSGDLRNARRAIDTVDLGALAAREEALMGRIEAGGYAEGSVADMIDTIRRLHKGEAMPADPTPTEP